MLDGTAAAQPGPFLAYLLSQKLAIGWRRSSGLGLGFIASFFAALVGGFAAFIGVFATAKKMEPKLSKALRAISVLVPVLFGLFQLWSGTSSFLAE